MVKQCPVEASPWRTSPPQFNSRPPHRFNPERVRDVSRPASSTGSTPQNRSFVLGNALLRRNAEFFFEKFDPRDQRRQPFVRSNVVELMQTLIRFALPAFAIGKLIRGKTFVVTQRAGLRRRLGVELMQTLIRFALPAF